MMRTSFPLSSALVLVLGAALAAQEDGDKKPDPEVQAKIKEFEKAIADRKMERDQEAVGMIDELLKNYADLHEKDQRSFIKALDKVFKQRPRKPENQGLYKATVTALGTIGGDVPAKILVSAYKNKAFDDDEWLSFREEILENIGLTKDERQIDFLLDRATRDPVDGVKRGAGKALRHFRESDQKVRKDIFSKLLIDYAKIEGDAHGSLDPGDAVAQTRQRTLKAIADPWNETLSALSGAQHRTAVDWQSWWNDNKHEDWK